MNYLTNYYKNLSEQLQEQVKQLEYLILEYRKTETQHVSAHDVERTGEDVPMIHGRVVTKKGNAAGKGAAKEKNVGFYPGMGTMPNYPGAQHSQDEIDAWDTISNSGRPTVEGNPIFANLMGQGSPLEVKRNEIFDTEERRRGNSEKGTGKKAMKKEKAIRAAEYDRRHGR
jgi:hypothetical protein